ncbi:hypothetical protein Brsp07_04542 [Brucella sp. NBRC 14130]|uniref:hypothetical protein n=1 Tax=Brucella sp. NBRC 14130 TaxID=3075483 RepID=UPI0030B27945
MTDSRQDATVERMERIQPLQAGQYWRSLGDIAEQGINKDTVLLIASIRWVDDAPHTIILRPHPDNIGHSTYITKTGADGQTVKSWFRYDEHRFLLDDFLTGFEYEPDYERIRAGEIAKVQGKINDLQAELLEAQANPAILAPIVEEGLRAADEEAAKKQKPGLPVPVAVSPAQLADMAQGSLQNALAHSVTPQSIDAYRAAAHRQAQIATIKADWIKSKTQSIGDTVKALTPYFEEQAAAALAATEDVRTYVARLLRGIETLDLYVGKGVSVETIREGRSAPKAELLTFVQRKLFMDEELAVYLDLDDWFDFTKTELFDKALREHPALVEQIFPAQRCVVAMATTRRDIDYGDPWTNYAKNEQNRMVFLLIRDGENIHRVYSPVESHLGSARLFPSHDEHKARFRGFDGSEIKLDDVAYTDKLARHEVMVLHYKRFLILACGLDHRLKLFGDFYEGPASFDFVTLAFQERYCRFLHDEDGAGLLPAENRLPLREWLAEKNAYLRSGSRVMCNWHAVMTTKTAPSAVFREHGGHIEHRYRPKETAGMAIAYRQGKDIRVDVEVSGYSYSSHSDRTFNCKVTLATEGKPSYTDSVERPYLVLDAVTPDEIHWYIHNRESRRDHVSYIRFFKRALRYVEAEIAAEADTRNRLTQALGDGGIATDAEAAGIVQQAVIAWRAAHRGRPLPVFADGRAPSEWKSLLDQMYMLAGNGKRQIGEIEEFARNLGYDPLRLVLSGGAKLIIYCAPLESERDDRFEPHAWVHRISVERGKTKIIEKSRRWAVLPDKAASETLVHEWDGAAAWAGAHTDFQSFAHKQDVLGSFDDCAELLRPFGAIMSEAEFAVQYERWTAARQEMIAGGRYVQNPAFVVPFALLKDRYDRRLDVLCVSMTNAHAALWRLAPSDEARAQLRKAFIKVYANKASAAERFDRDVVTADWQLSRAALAHVPAGGYIDDAMLSRMQGQVLSDPRLAEWFLHWQAKRRDEERLFVPASATDATGRLIFDHVLSIRLPDDYEPLAVRAITLTPSDSNRPIKYGRLFDMTPDTADDDRSFAKFDDSQFEARGYSMTTHRFVSRESALAYVREAATSNEDGVTYGATPATELPDAPLPPSGVERWYIVPQT